MLIGFLMGNIMKIIIRTIIIVVSIMVVSYFLLMRSQIGRYQIIMNSGSEMAGLITIKYDTVTGRTWRAVLPNDKWSEIIENRNDWVDVKQK